jgi:hypothetical protein
MKVGDEEKVENQSVVPTFIKFHIRILFCSFRFPHDHDQHLSESFVTFHSHDHLRLYLRSTIFCGAARRLPARILIGCGQPWRKPMAQPNYY